MIDWLATQWTGNRQLRFHVVGGYNTLFGYACFVVLYALLRAHLHYLVIGVIAHGVAVCKGFVAHRRMVFGSRGPWVLDFARFNVAQLAVLGAGLAALWGFVTVAKLDPRIGQAVVTVGAVCISYIAHRHFSFAAR